MNIFKTLHKKYLQKKFNLKVDIDKVYEDIYNKAVIIAKQHSKYKRSEAALTEVFLNDDNVIYNICDTLSQYVRDEYPGLHKYLTKRNLYKGYYDLLDKLDMKVCHNIIANN